MFFGPKIRFWKWYGSCLKEVFVEDALVHFQENVEFDSSRAGFPDGWKGGAIWQKTG